MDERVNKLVHEHRRIAEERMRGLPIYNERLEVEGVGFRRVDDRLLGVLISPWFINLVMLPGDNDDWTETPVGTSCTWEFPAGVYEFHAGDLEGVGPHYTAALFSSVADFQDQETARAIAENVLERLFETDASRSPESARKAGGDVLFNRTITRRGLLRRVMLMPD